MTPPKSQFPLCRALGLEVRVLSPRGIFIDNEAFVSASDLEAILERGEKVIGNGYGHWDRQAIASVGPIRHGIVLTTSFEKPVRKRELSESDVREAIRKALEQPASGIVGGTTDLVIENLLGPGGKEGGYGE